VSPFGKRSHEEHVSARALVLTHTAAPGASVNVNIWVAIEAADGVVSIDLTVWPDANYYAGVVGIGRWVPVTLNPDRLVGRAQLDLAHVPKPEEIAGAIVEVLGGPAVTAVEPDPWRVELGLRYAEELIAGGGVTSDQADAIRARIRAGI
jgi:hypothetical protein